MTEKNNIEQSRITTPSQAKAIELLEHVTHCPLTFLETIICHNLFSLLFVITSPNSPIEIDSRVHPINMEGSKSSRKASTISVKSERSISPGDGLDSARIYGSNGNDTSMLC